MEGILINHSGTSYWHNSSWFRCFFGPFLVLVIHVVVTVLVVLEVIGFVHSIILVLVVGDLPADCLILATSRMHLVLAVPVDSLHHHVVPVRVDPIVVVDVVLEVSAENPPLHNIEIQKYLAQILNNFNNKEVKLRCQE